jgi:hypothetical protein
MSSEKNRLWVQRADLLDVAKEFGLSSQDSEVLWARLESQKKRKTPFTLQNLLIFTGLLLFAFGFFALASEGNAWFGPSTTISVLAVAALAIGTWGLLSLKKSRWIGGGLLLIALSMVPVTLSLLQHQLWSPFPHTSKFSNAHDFFCFGAFFRYFPTFCLAAAAAYFARLPFLSILSYLSLFFIGQDTLNSLSFLIFSRLTADGVPAICIGFFLIAVAFWLDRKKETRFAFWAYLAGALGLWAGLSSAYWVQVMTDTEERYLFLADILYGLATTALLLASLFIRRNIFLIVGLLGVFNLLTSFLIRMDSPALFLIVVACCATALIAFGVFFRSSALHALKNRLLRRS